MTTQRGLVEGIISNALTGSTNNGNQPCHHSAFATELISPDESVVIACNGNGFCELVNDFSPKAHVGIATSKPRMCPFSREAIAERFGEVTALSCQAV